MEKKGGSIRRRIGLGIVLYKILALFFTFERIYFDYYYGAISKEPSDGTKWNIGKSKGFEVFSKNRKERIIHELDATTDIFWLMAILK